MITIDLCYYPDITQYRSAGDVRRAVEVFSKALAEDYSARIGQEVTITVLPVMDVRTQTYYMQDAARGAGIGLMKPVSYVLANRANPNVIPGAVAWRIIGDVEADTYLGQLFAHKNSGIKAIKDITKVHRIAYGDSFSTSNFLIPAMDLFRNGVHPFTSFRMAKFFGGHDGSAKAVYFLDADVGAGHDGAVSLLAMEKGFEDAAEKLITISKVDIYSDPVAIRKDLVPDAAKLTESLVAISQTPTIKKALEDFWGNVTKLGEADPSKYSLIAEALDALNLSDKDIL
ncbi:MAG: PhnD/SsuA/transferrin family substrate-binding protein [Chitinophagaceae bacterium]|nr:PhnD/SsuA/transferrin family substrate-binding protein [Chitinophagaceae bacterium]